MLRHWLATFGIFACVATIVAMHRLPPAPTVAGVNYGTAQNQKLDIYTPNVCPPGGCPVIVMSPDVQADDTPSRIADTYLSHGIVVVAVDHGMRSAASAADMAKAVLWAERHISGYGGDVTRLTMIAPDRAPLTAGLVMPIGQESGSDETLAAAPEPLPEPRMSAGITYASNESIP